MKRHLKFEVGLVRKKNSAKMIKARELTQKIDSLKEGFKSTLINNYNELDELTVQHINLSRNEIDFLKSQLSEYGIKDKNIILNINSEIASLESDIVEKENERIKNKTELTNKLASL